MPRAPGDEMELLRRVVSNVRAAPGTRLSGPGSLDRRTDRRPAIDSFHCPSSCSAAPRAGTSRRRQGSDSMVARAATIPSRIRPRSIRRRMSDLLGDAAGGGEGFRRFDRGLGGDGLRGGGVGEGAREGEAASAGEGEGEGEGAGAAAREGGISGGAGEGGVAGGGEGEGAREREGSSEGEGAGSGEGEGSRPLGRQPERALPLRSGRSRPRPDEGHISDVSATGGVTA